MSFKHKLYLIAASLLALGLGTVLVIEWKPVVAEVRWRSKVERVETYAESLRLAAAESDHDPYLLAGLMYVESGGDPGAVSGASALGLLQLKLSTAVEQAGKMGLGEPTREDLLGDSELNIRVGSGYLRWLLEYCDGDLERALVSYNAGPGKVNTWAKEAGSWKAWRDEREAAGNSRVLAYARDVVRFSERFRTRGRIAPSDESAPPTSPSGSPQRPSTGFVRP